MVIRPLEHRDRVAWEGLWQQYLRFYRAQVSAETTRRTFEQLAARHDGMFGLVAVDDDDQVVGFAHLIFHPSTWSSSTYCYLEDLLVTPTARGRSFGKDLIQAAFDEADRRGAARVYWQTQEYNGPARSLYDELAQRTSFIVYERRSTSP